MVIVLIIFGLPIFFIIGNSNSKIFGLENVIFWEKYITLNFVRLKIMLLSDAYASILEKIVLTLAMLKVSSFAFKVNNQLSI